MPNEVPRDEHGGTKERAMNRDLRSSSNDPTAEPATDQSTQTASGLSGTKPGPDAERNRDSDQEVVNRQEGAMAPRRYEQPVEED
jgi:hypothetical protein